MSNLLSLTYSSFLFVNDFTKMLASEGGFKRLNMLKPRNGLATKNNTASENSIFAVLKWRLFVGPDVFITTNIQISSEFVYHQPW
jgi:hypothetical protein